MDGKLTIKLELTPGQLEQLLKILVQQPYYAVKDVLEQIDSQQKKKETK